jgi:hypothetical protein
VLAMMSGRSYTARIHGFIKHRLKGWCRGLGDEAVRAVS